MQIAPTALISFSISTNVTALQACYGFTMGCVINFCELHIRHLIMPFINKCHPRYLLGEVNKLNVQLSALCKSILTPHCIFSLVCLSRRMTAEITMANKGIWGTIIRTLKWCSSHHCWWQEPCHCHFPAWGHGCGSLRWPPFRAAQDPWEQKSWSALQILTFKEFANPLLAYISVCKSVPQNVSLPLPWSQPPHSCLWWLCSSAPRQIQVCVFPFPSKPLEKGDGVGWTCWVIPTPTGPRPLVEMKAPPAASGPGVAGHGVRCGFLEIFPQKKKSKIIRRMKQPCALWSVPGFGRRVEQEMVGFWQHNDG